MARLSEELHMNRPFALLEEEATLAILHTADLLHQRAQQALKAFQLTPAQYNVLRILYGSPEGLPCGSIAERLVTRDPDITRLLDRMETRGWIERRRCEHDRRLVIACLTCDGKQTLERTNPVVFESNRLQFADWNEKEIKQLIDLLEKVRD